MQVTIRDKFFKKELTGEFSSTGEAKEFYAHELDTVPEDIEIVKVVESDGKPSRSDLEIVEQTNELARRFYQLHDRGGNVEKGYRFDQSSHPQEIQCWKMACIAQELLTETDVRDALDNLEDDS